MSLQATNLIIQMATIPAAFIGSPQEFSEEMVRRMRIVSPSGTNFIFIGSDEPASNVGPWLKNGTMWYVWDTNTNRYIPLDITDSETLWFHVGSNTPASSDPPVWLRTTQTPSGTSTTLGSLIGWYVWNGTSWEPSMGITLSGPTALRPTSPVDFQMYYDSDISTLIWWERAAWRTVDGVVGDIKFVLWEYAADALLYNPGWEILGSGNQTFRGRLISQATKDPGASPAVDLSVDAGVTPRMAHEVFGETDGVHMDSSSSVPYPPTIAMWTLVKV